MSEEWTQERLEKLCCEWQRVLRLQDWDVKVKVVRGHTMRDRQGECEYTQSLRRAVIRILDPSDWTNEDWPCEPEVTLVHELIHLHFAPFMSDKGEDDPETIAQETAIEQLAKAFVTLKRHGGAA